MRIMRSTVEQGGIKPEATQYGSGAVSWEESRDPDKVVEYRNMVGDSDKESKGKALVHYPGRWTVTHYAPVNEGSAEMQQFMSSKNIEEGDQIPLFHTRTGQGDPEVISLTGTKAARASNMTMLGVAQADALKQGKDLTSTYTKENDVMHSLSPFSSNLIEKLTGAKIKPGNNWDFENHERTMNTWMGQPEELTAEEIQTGRGVIRQTVRSGKLSKQFDAHNYEQLQIPGM